MKTTWSVKFVRSIHEWAVVNSETNESHFFTTRSEADAECRDASEKEGHAHAQ